MPRTKHVPRRSCLGCGVPDDQGALLRMVLSQEGSLKLQSRGHGRGGYLHLSESCWQAFLKKKHLYRTFRANVEKGAKEKLVQELRERNRE